MAIQFTDQTAKEAIESGKTVVIDFWATWCGPCMKLGPVVEELAEKYGDKAIIGKLNIDENDEIVAENRIRSIPTVLFFKGGEAVDRSVGLVKLEDLEANFFLCFKKLFEIKNIHGIRELKTAPVCHEYFLHSHQR